MVIPHVHNTAVDVAKFLEAEQAGAVSGIIKRKGLEQSSTPPKTALQNIERTVVA